MSDDTKTVAMVNSHNEPLGVRVQLVEKNDKPLGMALVDPNKVNKSHDPMNIVALAEQVQKADDFIKANCGSKLTVIADQIRYLQEQARKTLEGAKRDHELHHAACNIVKKPGNIYYLYRRPTGQAYFSLLSPEEWGSSCPHEFLDAYKLEYDQTWTPFKDIEKRTTENAFVEKIINHQLSRSDEPSNLLGLPSPDDVKQRNSHTGSNNMNGHGVNG